MAKTNCQYSQYNKVGLEQSMICSLTGKYCIKQRYCPTERRLVSTDDWQTCTRLKKEELQMANKKNTKKADIKKIVPVEEDANKKLVGTIEYEVILATPSYYVVNKDGINITINEINNYKRGDKVNL